MTFSSDTYTTFSILLPHNLRFQLGFKQMPFHFTIRMNLKVFLEEIKPTLNFMKWIGTDNKYLGPKIATKNQNPCQFGVRDTVKRWELNRLWKSTVFVAPIRGRSNAANEADILKKH